MKYLRSDKKRKKRSVATLTLTSLVDCFSILIVYLLSATVFGENSIDVPHGLTLPSAEKTEIATAGPKVILFNGQLTVDDKPVSIAELRQVLVAKLSGNPEWQKDPSVIIQADANTPFDEINPIVSASLQAGFAKVLFAAEEGGELL
ncbi:MAG: hypothetical protein COT74_14275 [Bdellovibrionales bacterium CG10_big_fil_rev_8_21_14_0_10_45_34]|nr:MAG: hypothetical protein COT74_14275 [Bdellovibrionales bacterium CG10_big_fil_rev_8_21_14_0_10_45_34]